MPVGTSTIRTTDAGSSRKQCRRFTLWFVASTGELAGSYSYRRWEQNHVPVQLTMQVLDTAVGDFYVAPVAALKSLPDTHVKWESGMVLDLKSDRLVQLHHLFFSVRRALLDQDIRTCLLAFLVNE